MTTLQKGQELSSRLVELLTVIIHIFALVGSVIAGRAADSIGRRLTIFSIGIIFFCVPSVMGLASMYSVALFGRFFAQVGVGYTLTIVPLYLAEVSPAFSRGFYTCFPQVFINTGMIIGYTGHYIFSKMKLNGWGFLIWEELIPLTLLAVVLRAMPESPRWLILKGRLREARSILCWTSSSIQESECQYTNICYAANIPESQFEEDIISVRRSESNTRWDLLRFSNPALLHMSACAIMIQLAQKACGCDTIVLYLPQILEKAGVVNINEKVLWILLIDLLKTVCAVVAAFLLDRYGRRKLLLISIGGMVVSLVTLGSCLINIDDIDKNRIDPNKKKELWVSQICIVSLFFYMGSFSIGMGPVGSVFISELFPLELRAKGCSTAYAVNQGASALVSLIFFLLNKPVSLGGAVFSFAVAAMGAWLFFFVTMPETKGFSLEEMLRLFGT
ncbi:hypothetical protein ACJRO7_026462 [Eucalyptus globulus]|uniref:Major facilitator superfamily (MFS) profile domain-containing protein n=1 Tax=Eucalyptus globulus TaxID=34317 RepID=A0ABD3JSZ3_EUCGL